MWQLLAQNSKACPIPVGAGLPANTGVARARQRGAWHRLCRCSRRFKVAWELSCASHSRFSVVEDKHRD
ncbi:hypothetical protein EGT09_22105 [Pseudomonas putida]|nr:hypothetical protein EGT09_22105 [Pseudomonas putida]